MITLKMKYVVKKITDVCGIRMKFPWEITGWYGHLDLTHQTSIRGATNK